MIKRQQNYLEEKGINLDLILYEVYPYITDQYINASQEGVHTHFLNGQIIYERSYTSGALDGPWKEWWEDGNLKTDCAYVDDRLHGECHIWYENGELKEKRIFYQKKKT